MIIENFILWRLRRQLRHTITSEFLLLKTLLKDMEGEKNFLKLLKIDLYSLRLGMFQQMSLKKF